MEINIIVEGKIHRGAVIGSREYQEEFVSEEVSDWLNEVVKLAWFAQTQPQACYAAFTFGLKHQWTYFLRTLPKYQDLLESLKRTISVILIPALTYTSVISQIGTSQRSYSPGRRLCLANSSREYASSVKVTTPLMKHITSQTSRIHQLPDESLSKLAQNVVSCERPGELKGRAKRIRVRSPPKIERALLLAAEKGHHCG